MSTPSIVPNDRLDKDFYLVLEEFRAGPAFRETDEGITYISLIDDLLTGQYDQVQRIVAFNPVEGWSRDASEDVAERAGGAHCRRGPRGVRRLAGLHRRPARAASSASSCRCFEPCVESQFAPCLPTRKTAVPDGT